MLNAPHEACKDWTQTKAWRYSIFTIDGIIWGSKVCQELRLEEKWDGMFTPMIQALQLSQHIFDVVWLEEIEVSHSSKWQEAMEDVMRLRYSKLVFGT